MGSKIQLKRLTSTDIDQSTVVLAVGEPCLAKDTDNKEYIVFGDGIKAIKDLKREPIGDSGMVSLETDDTLIGKGSTTDPLGVAISSLVDNNIIVESDGLYVPTVVKVSTKNLLPTVGEENIVYIVSDEKHIYYWNGTEYVQLTQDFAGMIYKGSVNKIADLPTTNLEVGDFYWVVDDALFKIYNGITWDTITLAKNIQGDFADTVTTSPSFIKNKKAEYVTYVPDSDGITATNVQTAIEALDDNQQKKQDKVTTAKENNLASWDNKGNTKDSGLSKTTTIAPLDTSSDSKIPTEKAIAKMKAEIDDKLNNQATSNSADQGDKAILPLMLNASTPYVMRNVSTTANDFKDEYLAGYVFSGSQTGYLNRTFNKLKLMVVTPGWVRIGIVRGTGTKEYDGVARGVFKGSPTYNHADVYPTSLVNGADDTTADGTSHTTLKKWLVCQWVATPGLHEWSIPDEIITSPMEYLFIECRMGVSGWVMNRTSSAITQGDLTIPANTVVNGATWPTSFLSKTYFGHGSYAVSNNMLDASCRPTYSAGEGSKGMVYVSWNSVDHSQTADNSPSHSASTSWLNIGVYKVGDGGTTYLDPIVENCVSRSLLKTNTNDCIAGYGPSYKQQQILAEKGMEIYALELIVETPGDFSFFVFSSNDPATAKIIKHFTLRTRAIGKQTIHLPEPVVLLPGQWCGVSGITEAVSVNRPTATTVATGTTLKKGYTDTCKFAYSIPKVSNWTQFGDDPDAHKTLVPFSSATGTWSTNRFNCWTNVKYVPGTTGGTGTFDFTGATFNDVAGYLNIALVCRTGTRSKLEDLAYSVTGDSISTYAGQISQTTDFGVTTNAAGNNAIYYPNSGSGMTISIDTTWWGVLGKQCRMRLIKNDAWSGSRVTGTDSATSSSACASTIRTSMLRSDLAPSTPNTGTGLGTNYGVPDVIFCMIGTNDLSGNVAVGAYSNTEPTDINTIIGAFEKMVGRHKKNYPGAKLVYFTIPRGSQQPYPYANNNGFSISQMADAFEYVAKNLGAYFIPLNYFSQLASPNPVGRTVWTPNGGSVTPRQDNYANFTVDYLHPNAIGHQIIADGIQRYCEEKF